MDTQSLVVGHTYYRLTFADRDLTMPGVTPKVFLGAVVLDDGSQAFAFQDTVSFVRFGSRLEMDEDRDGVAVSLLPDREVETEVLNIQAISREVAAAAARAAQLNDPTLPVLRTGWQ